jgi:hypothetical protein
MATPGNRPTEIPTDLALCFYGFDTDSPLLVTITSPDGAIEHHTLTLPRDLPWAFPFELFYPRLPGHPIGTYHVSAQQTNRTASLDVVVARAHPPRMLLLDPPADADLVVGVDLHFYLGGFPPGQPTTIHVYGSDSRENPLPYRTSFAVPIDTNGEAHVTLDTKPDDPPGCYGLLSQLVPADVEHPYPGFCIRPGTP